MINPEAMKDDEFVRWMEEQEYAEDESEEIEVGGIDDEPEEEEEIEAASEEFDEEQEDEDNDSEEDEEDLEQPEGDSDDNSDEEETDDEEEEDSTEEDEAIDGEPEESEEEQSEPAAEEVKPEAQTVEPKKYVYKANGQDFEFTEDEIKEQFGAVFAKAMDYTQKTQALKKHRQIVDVVEQEKLTLEDVNFAIDLLKGDKNAIAELIKKSGVDTLELETEDRKPYIPNNYGRTDVELDIQEITAEISRDAEYEITHKVLTKEWDDESWNEITKKPQLIKLLHTDVKNGVFDKINPILQKLKVQDSIRFGKSIKSDLDYYKDAVGVYSATVEAEAREAQQKAQLESSQRKIAEVKQTQEKRAVTKVAAKKRKAAAPTKSSAGTKKSVNYLEEALNMSDDDYLAWMEKKLK